ncbi:hypothetical protein BD311DRAFT_782213 [Dichomitus squalens]|uniref:Steroid 5-alpha reductase C-terminal domain-containing protein n=1 Tax=Dichomitus squalens TaxID=114155 RepID=A0A4V2JYV8_9APHY|nr:hypothetical protein BD311DRAFT_782213 [Dichomitus squalens]
MPSLCKLHLMVAVSAVFNAINGSLIGTTPSWPVLADAFALLMFWLGLALRAAGFAGNITHNEILNIRRNAKKASNNTNNGKDKLKQEHNVILHGLLYRFISYPNYF